MILPDYIGENKIQWQDLCYLHKERRCVFNPHLNVGWNIPGTYILFVPHSNEYYFGSAKNSARRLSEHRSQLNWNKHPIKKLQERYEETLHIQYVVFYRDSWDAALDLEQDLIDLNKNDPLMLNIALNARSSGLGRIMSEHTKNQLRKSRIGVPPSEYCIQRIKEANTGRKWSQEHKDKHAEFMKSNFRHTDEYKENLRIRMRGNKHGLGQFVSDEKRNRIKNLNLGKKVPEAIKEKNRKTWLEKMTNGYVSPKAKPVMIEGIKYSSMNEAAIKLNLRHGSVWNRIKSKSKRFENWYEL
jgi:predicted GIY-YIG superfamily endonuclease